MTHDHSWPCPNCGYCPCCGRGGRGGPGPGPGPSPIWIGDTPTISDTDTSLGSTVDTTFTTSTSMDDLREQDI